MKTEGTIGAVAFLAIAAVVGISVSPGGKRGGTGQSEQTTASRRLTPSAGKQKTPQNKIACDDIASQLQEYLEVTELTLPPQCYENPTAAPRSRSHELNDETSQLKFVIAFLPDPLHTHLPVVFDQFTGAIQEGAQDEKYDFDSSWLPWEEEEQSYALLLDQHISTQEKEERENQPGIILFRKRVQCGQTVGVSAGSSREDRETAPCLHEGDAYGERKRDQPPFFESYRQGLVVFVVGEDATHGIHRKQFRNALSWIDALEAGPKKHIAILGPTFSGSLTSLAQVLTEQTVTKQLDLLERSKKAPLAIYSGSVSGKESVGAFKDALQGPTHEQQPN